MPEQVRWRRHTTVPFTEDGVRQENLSRGFLVRDFSLRLRYDLTAGITAITPAEVRPGDEFALIRRIRIIANGSDVLRTITGEQLKWYNLFTYKAVPNRGLAGGVGASSTVNIDSTLIIPFWSVDTVSPVDTVLDTRTLSQLEIEIEWGNVTDVTDVGNSPSIANVSLEVHAYESFGLSGPFAQTRIPSMQEAAVAVQTEFEVDLNVSVMYRGFLINTKDANGDDLLNSLNNIKLKSGGTNFLDAPARMWQQRSLAVDQISTVYDPVADAISRFMVSTASNIGAWYWVDLIERFKTEALDTVGLSELKLEFDVAAAIQTMNILPLQIIPVRGQQAAG